MTAAEVLARGPIESLRDQRDHVRDAGPPGYAPDHAREQRAVQAEAGVLESRPASATGRAHGMTILSLVAVAQLGWLSVLGYGLFRLLA